MTPAERRQVSRFIALTLLILILGALIINNQNSIMTMQTDTLNTLNDMRLEEQSTDTAIETSAIDATEPTSLSPEERDLVQRVVAAEARGEGLQGQMAVAQTIKDRSDLWDMTVTEVCLADKQYAKPYQGEISDSVKLAVANIFDGGMRVFEEPTTHFASNDPYWADDKINRGSVGRHKFYY